MSFLGSIVDFLGANFWWGVLGGLMAEGVQFFHIRHRVTPNWARSWFYWIVVMFMALFGGILVVAYVKSGNNINELLAINIGASTPLILKQLVQQTPQIDPGNVD